MPQSIARNFDILSGVSSIESPRFRGVSSVSMNPFAEGSDFSISGVLGTVGRIGTSILGNLGAEALERGTMLIRRELEERVGSRSGGVDTRALALRQNLTQQAHELPGIQPGEGPLGPQDVTTGVEDVVTAVRRNGGNGNGRRRVTIRRPVTLPRGLTGTGKQSSGPQAVMMPDGDVQFWLPAGKATQFEKASIKNPRKRHTHRRTKRVTHTHRGGGRKHTHRRSRKLTAHQRKFAAAARRHGGKIPKGTDL